VAVGVREPACDRHRIRPYFDECSISAVRSVVRLAGSFSVFDPLDESLFPAEQFKTCSGLRFYFASFASLRETSDMKLAIFIILVTAIATVAQTDAQKTKSAADIRTVMDKQAVDWNRGDIPAFMEGYWKSDKLVFVGSQVTRGWQPTLDRYKKSYPDRAAMGTLTFSDLEITVVSKDAAVVLGSWSLQREKDKPGGKFTLIFRKFKEGWRIIHDHTS